jgi:hypothetical protein
MTGIIHIGYPKTASTFLQKRVFPYVEGCAYLHALPENRELRPLMHNMYFCDAAEYMPRTLATYLQEWRAAHPGRFLLSDENISGGLFLPVPNWERNAERLHAQLPDSRIVVVVRQQQTMLRSVYALYVQRGGVASLDDLLAGRAARGRFDAAHLEYHRLIGRYQELFGADRVHVVP